MSNKIIGDLVDHECILSAALIDGDGFTVERTSIDFKPTILAEILSLATDNKMATVVAEHCTIIASRLPTEHWIVIQCPNGSNLGKARMKLTKASSAILPFL